jgi:Fic family protein
MPSSSRSGQYVKQPSDYRAFIPALLPPEPPIVMDKELTGLLSEANLVLGRLDGAAGTLPNPDLFVAMYVRKEAVLSSQIEGTQSSLDDVLEFEVNTHGRKFPQDIEEVVNYVQAMNYGLKRIKEFPLSLRLIREIHAELLKNVRGSNRTPGEFRKSQNWIGPHGCTLATATFVPPPVPEMHQALGDLEKFLHDAEVYPALIHCGVAHAQFETIHPFLDGNGRVGRLLITFLLCQKGILQQPLLYLSHYFKLHRTEYYDRLMAIRNDGNWEGWLKFFLRGVHQVSEQATNTVRAILGLRDTHRQMITEKIGRDWNGLTLLDFLFKHPVIQVAMVQKHLKCVYGTANKLVYLFERYGILKEVTGRKRNRRYRYESYLSLFEESSEKTETE